MAVVVSLADIVNEMAEITGHHTIFLNQRTGEIVTLNEHQRHALEIGHDPEPGSDRPALSDDLRDGNLLELPSKFEHQEYSIVERFCHTVKDAQQRQTLFAAIHGKQAFRDFNVEVTQLGLEERWHGFRNQAFEEIAVAFLEKNGIAYARAA